MQEVIVISSDVSNASGPGVMPTHGMSSEGDAAWARCLNGDRNAFHGLIGPHLDELFAAAQRDIRYHTAVPDLRDGDLTPEELVGETLLRAWRDRRTRPQLLGLRAWLLGLQFRVLMRIVRQEQLLGRLISVSLEARAPEPPIYDDDEGFYEWFQPDEVVRWEDILAAESHPEPSAEVFEESVPGLSTVARQVLVMRHIHRLSFTEIAVGLRISRERLTQLWREGHARLAELLRRNANEGSQPRH